MIISYTDFIVPSFKHKHDFTDEDFDDKAKLAEAFGHVENAKNVHWCVWTGPGKRKVPLLSAIHFDNARFGNGPALEVFYQSAALLMEVPKFTSGRGVPVASVQAVLGCIEQVNEEVEKVEADLINFKSKEIMQLKSDEKMLQNKHTKVMTERNELLCMIPPSKRAKK